MSSSLGSILTDAHLPTIKPMEQKPTQLQILLVPARSLLPIPSQLQKTTRAANTCLGLPSAVVEQQRVAELQLQWFHQPQWSGHHRGIWRGLLDLWKHQSEDDLDQHKRFCPTTSLVERTVSSSSSSGPEDSSDEVAIVECQNGGISTSGANGRYEIVGDGRECKAVDMHSKTIFHCLIMKSEEYKTF
uniref:Uncharacterized protein n=1 Tax=Ditylenchus dipsaci TaxID=166011 RepID=A0A915EDV0_9BILA